MKSVNKPGPDYSEMAVPRPNSRRTVLIVCIFLAAAVFLVFGQTLRYPFVNYDDNYYVYQNPAVAEGLTFSGVIGVFTHNMCNFYHPLTMTSLMLDDQLYGLNAGGYHLTNVLLHAITVIVLFLVLRQMTGALWPSAFGSAMFAIHPLHVESVAWVAERKDVLSGLFFALTLGAYVRYTRAPFSLVRYLTVIFLFMLGLLSKPTLVTLPFVLLLLDYWPLKRIQPITPRSTFDHLLSLIVEKIPLFVLSAASCVATVFAEQVALAPAGKFSLSLRFGNAVASYATYLKQIFHPTGLAAFYPYPETGLPTLEVTLALALLIGICVVAMALWRRCPYLLVGWLWYLGMLVPMIGVLQVGNFARADRFTYLSQIGLYLAVAWAARDLTVSWRFRRQILGTAAATTVAALMVCAFIQTSYWRNSESLWRHALTCTSGNYIAYNNLGNAVADQDRFAEAIGHFRKAIEIKPDYAAAHYNLGFVLDRQGKLDEAIAHYQKALEIHPNYAEADNNLGVVLLEEGQLDAAIEHCQKALEINPDYAEAHYNLGYAFNKQDRLDEAIVHYKRAIELKPDYVDAYYGLGGILGLRNQLDEAAKQYRKAIEFKPDYVDAHGNLANVLAAQGKLEEATQEYRRTLELVPNSAQAHYKLGLALQTQRNFKAAITECQRALELDPRHLPAHLGLAWLLATSPDNSLRNGERAVELAEQAKALAGIESPQLLDTLAAAYAQAGRFPEAVETAKRALNLNAVKNDKPLTEILQARLKLYEAKAPFHEKP